MANLPPSSKPLERKFALYWYGINGPALVAEHRFHATRLWRFDFAHLPGRVAFELEGGVWTGGRHTTGTGFTADVEKYNEAALMGWTVFRLTGNLITVPYLERLAHHLHERTHSVDFT